MASELQVQHEAEEANANALAVVKKGNVDVPVANPLPNPTRHPKRIVNKGPILLYPSPSASPLSMKLTLS